MTLTTILVAWLAAFGLRILHLLYASFIAILSCRQFIHGPIPRPLGAPRKQLPTHLALLLVSDSRSSISELERVYVESVKRASIWCQDLCIENLTVYDRNGILVSCWQKIRHSLGKQCGTADKPLTIHVVSRMAGKPSVASMTRYLVKAQALKDLKDPQDVENAEFNLSVHDCNVLLESNYGFPSPEMIIIHCVSSSQRNRQPPELHGFPPWQIRLTEIHSSRPPIMSYLGRRSALVPLEELEFRRALDGYNEAEMRLGR